MPRAPSCDDAGRRRRRAHRAADRADLRPRARLVLDLGLVLGQQALGHKLLVEQRAVTLVGALGSADGVVADESPQLAPRRDRPGRPDV